MPIRSDAEPCGGPSIHIDFLSFPNIGIPGCMGIGCGLANTQNAEMTGTEDVFF